MATNLLKKYNQTLDLLGSNEKEYLASFRKVFNRDIHENSDFKFRKRQIRPTKAEGENDMDRLFKHLTTIIVNEETRERNFESERSIRLHWIKYHIEEKKKENFVVFTIPDENNRTYILDKDEKYVIILEPQRKLELQEFYLITAYKLRSSNYKKIMTKFEKRGKEGIPEKQETPTVLD